MDRADAWSGFKRYLLTGLIIIAPVGVTAWVLTWLFRHIDGILGRYVRPVLGFSVPGLGFVALAVVLLLVGWVSHKTVGRQLVTWWNDLLSRVPLVRRVYGASSQIVQAVFGRKETLFRACALIEYPSPGSYSLAFVTARAPRTLEERVGGEAVSVFLPTAPNPASGYLLVLPVDRVEVLDMTVEDGFKMVLSMGAALPGDSALPARGLDLELLLAGEGRAPESGEERIAKSGEPAAGDGEEAR